MLPAIEIGWIYNKSRQMKFVYLKSICWVFNPWTRGWQIMVNASPIQPNCSARPFDTAGNLASRQDSTILPPSGNQSQCRTRLILPAQGAESYYNDNPGRGF